MKPYLFRTLVGEMRPFVRNLQKELNEILNLEVFLWTHCLESIQHLLLKMHNLSDNSVRIVNGLPVPRVLAVMSL